MTRALALLTMLLLIAPSLAPADEHRLQDATGRSVTIPQSIERIFAAGPPASLFVFAVAPEKLLGWTRKPHREETALLPQDYARLPGVGRLTGRGGSANLERVMALEPDLIIDVGSTAPTYRDLASRMQEQSGIPMLLFDGRIDATPATLRSLGALTGHPGRGEALANWTEEEIEAIRSGVEAIPRDKRPRVYYARGPAGLETALSGAINVELLDLLGVTNVAGEALGRGGLASVSMEEILAWDPEVIVTVDEEFARNLHAAPLWQQVKAVRQGRVYLAPRNPFPWIDYPPGPNRLIGLSWLAGRLYPDHFPQDIGDKVKDFYQHFYHREPSAQEVRALLRSPAD